MHLSTLSDFPHRRLNPLTGEWVLVSPHRTKRPWKGQEEASAPENRPSYDPQCYLCPRNRRANGEVNPDYRDTFVFPNDFSAMLPDIPGGKEGFGNALTRARPVRGECHVICFSPRHDLTLPGMPETGIERVIGVWQDLIRTLGAKYRWVQIFENKGAVMGCSNPHPHGQAWAGDSLPNEPAKEEKHQAAYKTGKGRILLLDYLGLESDDGSRIVVENDDWTALVPFWATWPFETLLLPKRHVLRLPDMDGSEVRLLAALLKQLLCKYDNLFGTSFPYTMGWHGAPTGPGEFGHWQLHAHVYPPLLRSATVKKFMVGYEMLSEPQRDITPEQAAGRLKSLPASPGITPLRGSNAP